MKKKIKLLKKVKKIWLIIFLSLVLLISLIANFFYIVSYYKLQSLSNQDYFVPLANLDNSNNSIDISNPGKNQANIPAVSDKSTAASALTAVNGILNYSAVITVIYEQDLKILNFDVFDRNNQAALTPKEDWLRVSLNRNNNYFRVYCRAGYTIKDCSGGVTTRLADEQYCTRLIGRDIKNTISLECGS